MNGDGAADAIEVAAFLRRPSGRWMLRTSLFRRPVRRRRADIEPIFRTLVGVTDTVVPAGTHTMRIEAMCDPEEESPLLSSMDFYNAGVAMVIAP